MMNKRELERVKNTCVLGSCLVGLASIFTCLALILTFFLLSQMPEKVWFAPDTIILYILLTAMAIVNIMMYVSSHLNQKHIVKEERQ